MLSHLLFTAVLAAKKQKKLPPPPPPPPPAFSTNDLLEFITSLEVPPWLYPALSYFCIFWASVTLLTYLIPTVLASLRGPQDLKKRYNAQWALVTGASSGIGKA